MHGGTEMKRLLVAFFMILIVVPSYAENWIKFKSEVVEKAINQLVASERRQAAADEYQKNMDQTNGKISVTGIYKVCIASGFNIQTNDGYNLCRNFLNFMMSESKFGTGSATQQNCANKFNGIWTLSADGKKYQCVGKDGFVLNYKKSCRGEGGDCIKQFADLQTQGANGREFIDAYGKLKGINFTCHANADISTFGQDYIMCSAGGKAYEFEFDSLNQSPDSTSSNSENTAICELYGGKIVNTGDKYTEDTWQSCDISSELCNGVVHNLSMSIGHTSMYQGYCRLSREIKTVSVVGLKQIEGIDSRIFYNTGVQMRMDTAKPMAEEYLRTKFPNESYIVCESNPKKLNDGFGVDVDYVISCKVGSRQVDFIFDDISETFDSDAATGMEAMQCIINGGTFKGETCRGPTKEECERLDSVLRAKGSDKGARYDEDARACILGNAESTYKRDVTVGYITGAVVIVGGAILTIGTGGAAGPVVVNGVAMLVGDIAVNYAIDANHQRLTNKAAKKFVDFVTDADECTTEQCAIDVLEKHYATLSGVMSDLNTEDQAVVDATIDRLIGLIQTDFVACGEDDNGTVIYASPADCAIQSSHLTVLDYIDPYSEIALVIGSVIYDPGYVVARFMKLNKVTKVADAADAITDATRATNKADDLGKNIKILNADSPESEAGFAAMMKRVEESNAKQITAEDIETEFIRRQSETGASYTEADIAERMKNYNDYLASHGNGTLDTRTRYTTSDGSYTPERKQLHDQILDDLFKDADKAMPDASEQPTFVMLGGRGGSGKSSLKGLAYDPEKTVVIDADKIKTMLPEYSDLFQQKSKYAGLNAWEVHEESSDIVKETLEIAKERGINVVLDGTMSSTNSALKKIAPFKEAGYRIEGAYMYLPREESTLRGLGRGMNLDYSNVESGRFVPVDVLLDMKNNEKAFGEVSGYFDSWGIWTTEGVRQGDVPNLISHSEDIGVFERGDNFEEINNTDIDMTTFGK